MYVFHELGRAGEDFACFFLENNNYKIIERNFRCKQGEIDIVAKDISKDELVFIEVKTRSSIKYGQPSEAVNGHKQKHIYQASTYYVYLHRITNENIRFDVIEIFASKSGMKINHIKQIF